MFNHLFTIELLRFDSEQPKLVWELVQNLCMPAWNSYVPELFSQSFVGRQKRTFLKVNQMSLENTIRKNVFLEVDVIFATTPTAGADGFPRVLFSLV